MNRLNTISISELKQHPARALNDVVVSQKPKIIVQRSTPKAVIMDIDYFNALQEAYEDYLDTLEFDKTISLKRVSLKHHQISK